MAAAKCTLVLSLIASAAGAPFSIADFGAVAGVDTHAAALQNGAAFARALAAANASSAPAARAVLIPPGVWSYLPAAPSFDRVSNVSIFVEGTVNVSTANASALYPGLRNGTGSPWSPFGFRDCAALRIVSESGEGLINGRGNAWWWYTILTNAPRPNLLDVGGCAGLELTGVSLLNGPQYHAFLMDASGVLVQRVTVMVDVEDQLDVYSYVGAFEDAADARAGEDAAARCRRRRAEATGSPAQRARVGRVMRAAARIGPTSDAQLGEQLALARRSPARLAAARRALLPEWLSAEAWFDERWRITPPFPMVYALNTDGIDVSGADIVVRNCSITNFDDTVCPKPRAPPCTTNFLIEDTRVVYGLGISMGSVPPDVGGNCIDGVVARRSTFQSPLKAFYIKPNPEKFGQNATGLIANITYENATVFDPLWWAVWIGPQQDNVRNDVSSTRAPGEGEEAEAEGDAEEGPAPVYVPGDGCNFTNVLPGCSFAYPLCNTTCPTDPQVSVRGVTLRDVVVYNSLLSPGVIIHNATNPGTGFEFDNVVFVNGSAWPVKDGYWCLSTQGVASRGTTPAPPCFSASP